MVGGSGGAQRSGLMHQPLWPSPEERRGMRKNRGTKYPLFIYLRGPSPGTGMTEVKGERFHFGFFCHVEQYLCPAPPGRSSKASWHTWKNLLSLPMLNSTWCSGCCLPTEAPTAFAEGEDSATPWRGKVGKAAQLSQNNPPCTSNSAL